MTNKFIFPNYLLILISSLIFLSFDKPAWKLFSKTGKTIDYKTMVEQCSKADIILFGEIHNNPIAHWLQLELTKDLGVNQKLILGGEFFETDNQDVINEYLMGLIEYRHLKSESKMWDNFETDYLPILSYAKSNKLPFVATNIPRRYASMVARLGMDTLVNSPISSVQKSKMPPLPLEINYELPGYKALVGNESMHGHAVKMTNMAEAQALKDATMAKSIYSNFKPGSIFLHINGAYHSNNFEGIFWYLKKHNPDLKIVTITTVEQDEIESLEKENKELADFIITTPGSLTKTH